MSSAEHVARHGRRAAISIVAFALMPTTTLYGQSVASTSRTSEPAQVQFAAAIRLAELEGAQAPRDSVAGRDARRCVDASGQKEATSGQFTAGSFVFYATLWHQGYGKLWWRPKRPSAADTLVLRATRLSDSSVVREYRKAVLARPVPDNGDRFYMMTDRLPMAGTWLLTVRAGRNWGCFLLEL